MLYSVDEDGRLWEHDGNKTRRAGDTAWGIMPPASIPQLYGNLTDAYMHKAQEQAGVLQELRRYLKSL